MREDNELVSRVLGGDRAAFDTLVTRYRAPVYRQVLRRVGDPQDAEEITQIVFLRAYQGLPRLRQTAGFGPWIRAITAHETSSWIRGRRPQFEEFDAAEGTPDSAATPEQALLREETRQAIRRAIAALPEHERRVAQAFYLQERSYQEIQNEYGLAASSIAGYLYRARKKLSDRLGSSLQVVWLPALAFWQSSLSFLTQGEPQTKAAGAVAAVAAVGVAAGISQAPIVRPAAPRKPAAPTANRAVSVLPRPLSLARRPAPAFGTSPSRLPAEAAVLRGSVPEAVFASTDLTDPTAAAGPTDLANLADPAAPADGVKVQQVEEGLIVLQDNGRTRRFQLKDGKLFVEEDGKTRPATEEETASFQRVQERVKALKARAEMIKARAEALRPKEEELRRLRERTQERAREIEKEVRAHADEIRKRVEERMKLKDAEVRELQQRAQELARKAREKAEMLRKLGDPKGAEKAMEELQQQLKSLDGLHENIARSVERAMKEVEPLMQKIGPLTERMRMLEKDLVKPEEIQKLVERLMSELQPLLKEADFEGQSKLIEEEIRRLNEKARKATPERPKLPGEQQTRGLDETPEPVLVQAVEGQGPQGRQVLPAAAPEPVLAPDPAAAPDPILAPEPVVAPAVDVRPEAAPQQPRRVETAEP